MLLRKMLPTNQPLIANLIADAGDVSQTTSLHPELLFPLDPHVLLGDLSALEMGKTRQKDGFGLAEERFLHLNELLEAPCITTRHQQTLLFTSP